jgi:hypothetical protein
MLFILTLNYGKLQVLIFSQAISSVDRLDIRKHIVVPLTLAFGDRIALNDGLVDGLFLCSLSLDPSTFLAPGLRHSFSHSFTLFVGG